MITDMTPEELETLRKTLAQKKRKAKTFSSISKKVRFKEPKVREVPSKLAPIMVEVALETTVALPPSVLIP